MRFFRCLWSTAIKIDHMRYSERKHARTNTPAAPQVQRLFLRATIPHVHRRTINFDEKTCTHFRDILKVFKHSFSIFFFFFVFVFSLFPEEKCNIYNVHHFITRLYVKTKVIMNINNNV